MDPATQVVYAPLDVNLDYADHAIRMAVKREGGQREMTEWLREEDQLTRGTMVNLMRNGMPFSFSLG